MKDLWAGLGLASLALVLAVPAQAGVSEDFAGCDGLRKPKRSDDGMRGEATLPGIRWNFFRQNDAPDPRGIISSCDRAFETGKLLPEQTLRRAHMMRARGAAQLQLGEYAKALADFESARAAGREYDGDFFYERSMGVSLDLLRAIALNDLGRRGEALALSDAALAKRPYALAVQRVATFLRAGNGDAPTDPALWQTLAQIDPATRSLTSQLAGTSDDFRMLAATSGEPVVEMPGFPTIQQLMQNSSVEAYASKWISATGAAMRTAYAHAATGDAEAARRWMEATRAALTAEQNGEEAKHGGFETLMRQMAMVGAFDPYAAMVEARIAVNEGRFADAAAALEGKNFKHSPITDDLWDAYAAATADGDAPALPALGDAPERTSPKLAALAPDLLMRPESERKLIDYKKSRPNVLAALAGAAVTMGVGLLNGIPRTSGFEQTELPDGTVKVEYTGNTTSGAMVQEMTLLRAAEIAQEAGKTHFHIAGREDYQRYLTQSQYGVERSRTLTGYKTVMTIALLDDGGANSAQAVDALAVIDALGPIYYGE
ncbi:hypothetical protein LCM19_12015 [Qipengyuania flava]|nr:hypothetical protein [Qipengyuania flava]